MNKEVKRKNILVLCHQGFSFADDLISQAHECGFTATVLTSKIRADQSDRYHHLELKADFFFSTEQPALAHADIHLALNTLQSREVDTVACISVWEGYRLLMAETNATLGACDEQPERLALVLDKYRLRLALLNAHLSQTQTCLLTDQSLPTFQSRAVFIKPRWGLGSFAAFRWTGEPLKEKLAELSKQMATDVDYAGIFSAPYEFVAEDEICGHEYSFEVIAANGQPSILAVHEKLDLDLEHGSVLEKSCAAPPISLPDVDLRNGIEFIHATLKALSLRHGCYHIEARFNTATRKWEIIEINPRVGGAFIVQSTRWVSGHRSLRLWLESLVPSRTWQALGNENQLTTLESYCTAKGRSYFRVYFGTPGKQINKIATTQSAPQPHSFRQLVKEGELLPHSNREIFLGQALWLLGATAGQDTITELNEKSKTFFEVGYAN